MKKQIIITLSITILIIIILCIIIFIFLQKSNYNNNPSGIRYGDRKGYEDFCNNFDYDKIEIKIRITNNKWNSEEIIKNDFDKDNIYELWEFIKNSKEALTKSDEIYNIQMNINFYQKSKKKDIIWIFKNFNSNIVFYYHYSIKSEIGPTIFSGYDNKNYIKKIVKRYSDYNLDEIFLPK